jgi:hypothetical protein
MQTGRNVDGNIHLEQTGARMSDRWFGIRQNKAKDPGNLRSWVLAMSRGYTAVAPGCTKKHENARLAQITSASYVYLSFLDFSYLRHSVSPHY